MSQDLMEAARRVASEEAGRLATNRWGIVQNVDARRRAVRVRIMPEGVLSGWLPILQQGAGPSWSMSVIPEVGWQAFLLPETGNGMSLVVIGFASPVSAPAPEVPNRPGFAGIPRDDTAPAEPGEVIITGSGGAVIRLCPDGTVYIKAGQVGIDGDLRVNGEISDRYGFMSTLRTAYNTHQHTEHDGPLTSTTTVTTDSLGG